LVLVIQITVRCLLNLEWFNNNPDVDYRLYNPQKREGNLRLKEPEKHLFRLYRDIVLTRGELLPLSIMTHFICWWAIVEPSAGVTPASIVEMFARQFELEEDYLRKRVLQVQDLQRDEPGQRP
jgi:hypothetical protein